MGLFDYRDVHFMCMASRAAVHGNNFLGFFYFRRFYLHVQHNLYSALSTSTGRTYLTLVGHKVQIC